MARVGKEARREGAEGGIGQRGGLDMGKLVCAQCLQGVHSVYVCRLPRQSHAPRSCTLFLCLGLPGCSPLLCLGLLQCGFCTATPMSPSQVNPFSKRHAQDAAGMQRG